VHNIECCASQKCRTVDELLFGYEDELLASLANVVPSLASRSFVALLPNMTSRTAALAVPRSVMSTQPYSALGDWSFLKWQGLQEVTCWNDHTEVVTGASDGLQFQAGLTKNDSLHVFVPELFRRAKLNATGTVRFVNLFVHEELLL
jgi:hypothetical protein